MGVKLQNEEGRRDQKVGNYDLALRASRYRSDLDRFWNIKEVYSGLADNLQSRAREHTFPNEGTGGLALSRYPELYQFGWLFCFVTLRRFCSKTSCDDMLLKLGEQMWRAANGWPLLCLK